MSKKVAAPAPKKVAAPAPKPSPSNVVREERSQRVVHTRVSGGLKVREVREERQVVEVTKVPMQKHSAAKALKAPTPAPPKAKATASASVKVTVTGAAHKPAAKR